MTKTLFGWLSSMRCDEERLAQRRFDFLCVMKLGDETDK